MQCTEIFLALKFQLKMFHIFLIFAQNIDCGYTLEPPRQGGSKEYPQSMFWSKNKKNRYTPAYPSLAIYTWGSRGYTLHGHVFLMIIRAATSEQQLVAYAKTKVQTSFVVTAKLISIIVFTPQVVPYIPLLLEYKMSKMSN